MPRVRRLPIPDRWPPLETDDRDTVTIVVTSEPDSLGRQSFWIRWYDANKAHLNPREPEVWRRGWRAQHFFAVVRYYEAMWRRTTLLKVEVVEAIE